MSKIMIPITDKYDIGFIVLGRSKARLSAEIHIHEEMSREDNEPHTDHLCEKLSAPFNHNA